MAKLKRNKGLKDLTGDGNFTYADVLKMRGVKPKKSMGKGGTVEYGLGGAIMAGVNAIKNKEGLIGGIKNVAKAYVTPGSGIAQGAKLAGGMLANSNNPLLSGIGKVAGMASNFMPGGGGAKGALGNLAQAGNLAGKLPGGLAGLAGQFGQNAGGSGMAGVMPALQGLFSQKHGGMVPVKLKYASGGMAVPEGGDEETPVASFLLNRKPEAPDAMDFRDINDLQGARSDRQSAFGTASTDVYMPVGDVPTMPDPEPVDEPSAPRPGDMAPIAPKSARLLKVGADRELQGGMQDMPGKMQDEFTGFITAPYLRRGQVPTNIKVRNPKTRQFEDRQMEPEEIADYIFKNQLRRSPRQMMTREKAMEKARQIMRSRS